MCSHQVKTMRIDELSQYMLLSAKGRQNRTLEAQNLSSEQKHLIKGDSEESGEKQKCVM